jgi:hypothetical protein
MYCVLSFISVVLATCSALQAGSGGGALYVSQQQGLYLSRFPMPTAAVTIDIWIKLAQVRWHLDSMSILKSSCLYFPLVTDIVGTFVYEMCNLHEESCVTLVVRP